jgi:hypothetical protein
LSIFLNAHVTYPSSIFDAPSSILRVVGITMGDLSRNGQELASCQQYRTLLGVAEAISAHRDLPALFHELADRLHQVVRFDFLLLI